jgi:peptidoglycan-N-acetylglucosamine deacetylase
VKTIHLTFDDGPLLPGTEKTLEVLGNLGVSATFFLVAERARAKKELARRILSFGHSIGNHSLDHHYGAYFLGKKQMLEWIRSSEEILSEITGKPTVGFRPPAGIRTPDLYSTLLELRLPMILWDIRFYDAVFPWGSVRALRSLEKTRDGSIVLLHDAQKENRLPLFLKTLEVYIRAAMERGFELRPLSRKEIP